MSASPTTCIDTSGAQATVAAMQSASRKAVIYSILVLLPVMLGLTLGFFLARTDGYLKRNSSVYLAGIDYPYTIHNANNDVVIFGDSTGLTGVRPDVIESRTGLKACNLSQAVGSFIMTGCTLTLDRYLASNKQPEFIVLHLATFNLAPRPWDHLDHVEGMLSLLRNRPDRQTAEIFLHHPFWSLQFSSYVLEGWTEQLWSNGEAYRKAWQSLSSTKGYLELPLKPLDYCHGPYTLTAPEHAWINSFRRKYSPRGIKGARLHVACSRVSDGLLVLRSGNRGAVRQPPGAASGENVRSGWGTPEPCRRRA